ncbi:DoxX family protein [Pseudoponticoccus marisrubri]|uniref:DoxX n=1 Tax=Pseudoponticoccus marisrubri TaxID=1685382 RepID=A0A0W7WND0_9RHOB|nr:DoxX family protein [Pseudoponticoccus marisrubri]KUF12091.1 hypothetical protein AVJ23_05840 [Pseudoponticoccus marisrubri]
MDRLVSLHHMIFGAVARYGEGLLPLLARLVFAATLLGYFWASALTKVVDRKGEEGILDIFTLELGVYAQMFPKAFEAAGYDASKLGPFYDLIAYAGTFAEFLLPLLIVVGLFTRLAALGMIGFVIVQTLTDLYGHGSIGDPAALGAWFDRVPDALILDQRAFWMLLLVTLVVKGAGVLSLDRVLVAQGPGRVAPA